MGHNVLFESDLEGEILQFAVVRLDHVGKSGSKPVIVGADQRVHSQQVDMVLDDDQVALLEMRIEPAAGVGDDQQPAAQFLHHPDREGDLGRRVSLVEMKSPFHRNDRVAGQGSTDELTPVAFHRGSWEIGDLGVGNRCGGVDFPGQGTQAGTQNETDCRRARPAGPHRPCRLLDLLPFMMCHGDSCKSGRPDLSRVKMRELRVGITTANPRVVAAVTRPALNSSRSAILD